VIANFFHLVHIEIKIGLIVIGEVRVFHNRIGEPTIADHNSIVSTCFGAYSSGCPIVYIPAKIVQSVKYFLLIYFANIGAIQIPLILILITFLLKVL
jgi:hypothetical protein